MQFERLYHELSAHVPTTFLVVPRHGPRGRFLPVKEPADLEEARPLLREMLGARPSGTWPGRHCVCSCRLTLRRVAASSVGRFEHGRAAGRPGTKPTRPYGWPVSVVELLDVLLPRLLRHLRPDRRVALRRAAGRACSAALRRGASAAAPLGPWPVRRCAECSGRRLAFASARAAIVYERTRGRSSPRGRSAAAATWPRSPPGSSSRRCRGQLSTCSRSSRATATGS